MKLEEGYHHHNQRCACKRCNHPGPYKDTAQIVGERLTMAALGGVAGVVLVAIAILGQ